MRIGVYVIVRVGLRVWVSVSIRFIRFSLRVWVSVSVIFSASAGVRLTVSFTVMFMFSFMFIFIGLRFTARVMGMVTMVSGSGSG